MLGNRVLGLSLLLSVSIPVLSVAGSLDTVKQKYSYATGVKMANLLKASGISGIDATAFSAAIDDVMSGRKLQLTQEAMDEAVVQLRAKIAGEAEQAAEKNKAKGKAFLEKNKTAKGVTVLDNGLQYQVLKTGTGKIPSETDKVRVHYHGTLIDGTVFDSSVDRGKPAVFPLNRVIAGFREPLTRMKVGSKWKVFVPYDLGYGSRGAGDKIGPYETLIFDIELLGIE